MMFDSEKKCIVYFAGIFAAVLFLAYICFEGTSVSCLASRKDNVNSEYMKISVRMESVCSAPRILDCDFVEKNPECILSENDYEILLKIVEAEAGGEDENGKLLVANVILNRVESELFPDTVADVVYQCSGGTYQFSPVKDGRLDRVIVSDETINAVERALHGEDISQGAMYFMARCAVSAGNSSWFDKELTRLFAYGGHEFFE